MSKSRMVNTKFWDDNYVVKLDPIEKLLFLYFLTNTLTNISGVYEVQTKRVSFDTGISEDVIEEILKRFEKEEKIYYIEGWIIIKNFIKHQSLNPKVKIGIKNELEKIPENIWLKIKKNDKLYKAIYSLSESIASNLIKSNLIKEELNINSSLLSSSQFFEKCKKSKKRYIQILGDYAEEKKINFKSTDQWIGFCERNEIDAIKLEPYTEEQMSKAMIKLDKAKETYLTEWNLKTLIKFLDQ